MRWKPFCLIVLAACTATQAADATFESRWAQSADRIWVGEAYWANPLQDWRVRDGRLECIHAANDRNVHLLTYQLGPQSSLTMRVTVDRPVKGFRGWVGMRFGSRGRFDEYRHNAIYGQGIDAGLTAEGTLFVGEARRDARWSDQAVLELTLKPSGAVHAATLVLRDGAGAPIAQVRTTLPSGRVAGNLALVCHANRNGPHGRPVTAFRQWVVTGRNLRGGPEQNWGPILWTQYTADRGVLKLSAQFPPLGPKDPTTATLEVRRAGRWTEAARADIDPAARVALFRVENWTADADTPYRVTYRLDGRDWHHEGIVRKDPVEKPEIVLAAFTGNKDYGFPNREIVANVRAIDPDLLFFSGDQIYETVAGYGIVRKPVDLATLDYLRKWYLLGWSFGDLLADRPSVIIPDDHDVYHGNLWGQGGRHADKCEQGGYVMPPEWVNMIQRTQTAHLPDPFDPTPVAQGITVYYTDMIVGRIGFAILEDRKFKTGPGSLGKNADTSKAVLLGDRQLAFLRQWAADWRGCDMKATLSQTVFAQCHTHGGNAERPIRGDRDSNGWPPEARDRAIHEIRKAFALMVAGDNHLPTVAWHGIDTWEDAGISFTVPSIAAGFPRAWWPDKAGLQRRPGAPEAMRDRFLRPGAPEYIGRYISAWGHPLTMLAAANPGVWRGHRGTEPGDIGLLDRKSSGFGIVRFHKPDRRMTIECYRILADLAKPRTAQFPGWPLTVEQTDGYGRKAVAWLPTIDTGSLVDPVVQVIDESDGEVVYTLRIRGTRFQAKVFRAGRYTVKVGEPPHRVRTLTGLEAGPKDGRSPVRLNAP